MLDFPTAWEIQRTISLEHQPRCSSVPGWHPLSGSAWLCDCGAVEAEFKRQQVERIRRTIDELSGGNISQEIIAVAVLNALNDWKPE